MWKYVKTDPILFKKKKKLKQTNKKHKQKQTTTKKPQTTNHHKPKQKLVSSLHNMQAELKTNCNGLKPKVLIWG